jgi:serine phosphatase RsbU (regulator of sigma subunit)/Tfp pilus assembly protein PilF
MKNLCLILFLLISFQGFTQFNDEEQHQIDSLNKVIANPNSPDTSLAGAYVALSEILYISNIDTLKYLCEKAKIIAEKALKAAPSAQTKKSLLTHLGGALNNIGYVYMTQGDIPKALEYYHKSLKIQEEIGDKEGLTTSLNNIGNIYDNQGDIPKALAYYHKSLKIREIIGDKKGIAQSLNNIGFIYNEQGDIPKALEYHHKSLKIKEEIGHKEGIAHSLNNIGMIYNSQGDIPKALEYYHKSLKILEEIGDNLGIATSLNNIGSIYLAQRDIPKALEYYHKSLKIQEEIGNKNGIANSLNNIGVIYSNQGDIPKALEYHHKSLKIKEEIGDKKGIAHSLNNIGSIELKKGNTSGIASAKQHFLKSLEIAQEIGYPRLISSASSQLSTVYEKQGQGMLALAMHQLHIKMRDSINNEATLKASIQQGAKYAYEKVQAVKDAAHEKQLAIEKEAKAKQQVITAATGGGLGLVAIFLFFVMNRLKVTRKQKAVIEQQKEVVEEAHDQLEQKNQEIMDSITYAKRIQSAILPAAKVVKEYLKKSFILYKPKDVVAGDFYWMESVAGKVLFAAADCTGHGVPGAMVSVVCNNALNRSVREYGLTDPGQILDKTREIVVAEFEKSEEDVKDGMDIAICSLEGNKLQYAGAHNPLWIIRNGAIIETKANKQPIGQFDHPEPYITHSFDLEAGDAIYIFSDGYVDQFGGEKGKKFKSSAFREILLSIQNKAMEEQKTIIDESFESWKGDLEQIDDVCVIGVKI